MTPTGAPSEKEKKAEKEKEDVQQDAPGCTRPIVPEIKARTLKRFVLGSKISK